MKKVKIKIIFKIKIIILLLLPYLSKDIIIYIFNIYPTLIY